MDPPSAPEEMATQEDFDIFQAQASFPDAKKARAMTLEVTLIDGRILRCDNTQMNRNNLCNYGWSTAYGLFIDVKEVVDWKFCHTDKLTDGDIAGNMRDQRRGAFPFGGESDTLFCPS